jgi:hypothetical protein
VEASRAQGGDASSASSSASSSIRGSNLGAPPTAGSTQATGASGASGHMHQVALKERWVMSHPAVKESIWPGIGMAFVTCSGCAMLTSILALVVYHFGNGQQV